MKYSQAEIGRVFIMRLYDGETIHDEIEKFAKSKDIKAATVSILGGIDKGSILVVGPKESRAKKIFPMTHALDDTHEAHGIGTIFPDKEGVPILHLHLSAGRDGKSVTGCIRQGVVVWQVMEVVITELLNSQAVRLLDEATGFELMTPVSE